MLRKPARSAVAALGLAVLLSGCGSGGPAAPSTPTPTPIDPNSVTASTLCSDFANIPQGSVELVVRQIASELGVPISDPYQLVAYCRHNPTIQVDQAVRETR